MVKPGMQMAEKMPDAYIQLWGASLLRGMTVTVAGICRIDCHLLEIFLFRFISTYG